MTAFGYVPMKFQHAGWRLHNDFNQPILDLECLSKGLNTVPHLYDSVIKFLETSWILDA